MSAIGEKQKGAGQDRAHPDQDRAGRAAAQARVDPRESRPRPALHRDQAHPARAPPAHGVRGSVLPQHRRMLRQGHRDVHDPGRPVHPPLPVLRRGARQAAAARRGGAVEPRPDHRGARTRVRRDHQRRPRRPARRRRAAFRGLHTRRARALARHAHRSAGAGLPRPARDRARQSSPRRRPT